MVECTDDDRDDPSIVQPKSDQCSRVQDHGGHQPSARSAAFISEAVSGPPPVSATISSSITARSSSFNCSSNARTT